MIEHRIVIDQMGLFGPEDDRTLISGTVKAVTECRAAAFIYETQSFWGDEEPAAAVIPADVARELIAEGRLAGAPLAGMTVLARDVRPEAPLMVPGDGSDGEPQPELL